jgi:hypothetical protein
MNILLHFQYFSPEDETWTDEHTRLPDYALIYRFHAQEAEIVSSKAKDRRSFNDICITYSLASQDGKIVVLAHARNVFFPLRWIQVTRNPLCQYF